MILVSICNLRSTRGLTRLYFDLFQKSIGDATKKAIRKRFGHKYKVGTAFDTVGKNSTVKVKLKLRR